MWLLLNLILISLYLLFVKNFYLFFYNNISNKIDHYIIIYLIAFLSVSRYLYNYVNLYENDLFNINKHYFIIWTKFLLILIFISFWFLLKYYLDSINNNFHAEILILLSSSMLGLYYIICSKDFIWLYISIELYSLSIYGLMFFFNSSYINSSIKYFINGSVSSILLLFSITIIYAFTGSFTFESLYYHTLMFINNFQHIAILTNIFFVGGLSIFILSFILKLGLAPFYIWAVDTYTTQPFFIFFYLLITVKFTLFNFLFNFFIIFMHKILEINFLYYIFFISALLSIIVGTFAIIIQTNLKKIFFYSSLSNSIFLLIPFLDYSTEIFINYIVFNFFYFLNLLGFLFIITFFKDWSRYQQIIRIESLTGLAQYNPILAFIFSILLLSFTGFPPFIGFFVKFSFLLPIYNYSPFICFIIVISSVISNIYSWWLITLMYFYKKNTPVSLLIKPTFAILTALILISFYFNFILTFYFIPLFYSFVATLIYFFIE